MGYTKLRDDARNIKMKKVTGITPDGTSGVGPAVIGLPDISIDKDNFVRSYG